MMKQAKRILCVMLAFALGLAWFIPASAMPAAPIVPVITKLTPAQIVKAGKGLTLEVEAAFSVGSGTLNYAWYDIDPDENPGAQPIGTDTRLVVDTMAAMKKHVKPWVTGLDVNYYVLVTTTFPVDEFGGEQTSSAAGVVKVRLFYGIIDVWRHLFSSAFTSPISLYEIFVLPYYLLLKSYGAILNYLIAW